MKKAAGPARYDADGDERALLKSLLNAGVMTLLNLPAALEAEFLAHHHRTAVGHIRANWPLIIPMLFLAAAAPLMLGMIPPRLYAMAAVLFVTTCALCALVIIVAHSDRLQAYFPRVAEALVVIVLLLVLSMYCSHLDLHYWLLITSPLD